MSACFCVGPHVCGACLASPLAPPVQPGEAIELSRDGCRVTIHLPADALSVGLAMGALAKAGFDWERTPLPRRTCLRCGLEHPAGEPCKSLPSVRPPL